MAGLLALFAYALISLALHVSKGYFQPLALAFILAGLVLATLGGTLRTRLSDGTVQRWLRWLLPTVLAVQLAPLAIHALRRIEYAHAWVQLGFCILPAFWPVRSAWARRFLLALIFLSFIYLFQCRVIREGEPPIDVWHFQERACELLLGGENPYSAEYPNIYDHEAFYPPGCVVGGMVNVFPYPPLSIVFAAPGNLLGDVRWSLLAALLGTVALMLASARQLGLPAGHPAELAALALLFQPRVFYLLQAAWTEPFVALAFAFLVWNVAAGRSGAAGIGLVLAAKQYGLLLMPTLLLGRRIRMRELALGGMFAFALTAPFLLWNMRDFIHDAVWFHLRGPFRWDALSVLVGVKRLCGWQAPALAGFVAMALIAAWTAFRPPRDLAAALCGSAAMLLAFFAFNKQAFFNYYWLTSTPLLLAVIASWASLSDHTPPEIHDDSASCP